MKRPAFLPALLSALLAACSGILGGDTYLGTFTSEITGAVSAKLAGEARAEPTSVTVGESYGISMVAADGRGIYLYSRSRPSVGVYRVVPFEIVQPEEGFTAVFMSTGNGGAFQSRSGEVRITASGGDGLAGTFDFQAEDPNPGGAGTVRVTGSFTAR